MDFPEGLSNLARDAGAAGLACPADGLFSIADWGEETGFSAQIGPARNALMDARDHLRPSAVETLAKLYLYFGFGAEALGVLRLDPQVQSTLPELTALAHIFEHGTVDSGNPLADYTTARPTPRFGPRSACDRSLQAH